MSYGSLSDWVILLFSKRKVIEEEEARSGMSLSSKLDHDLVVVGTICHTAEVELQLKPLIHFQVRFHDFGLRLPGVTAHIVVLQLHRQLR